MFSLAACDIIIIPKSLCDYYETTTFFNVVLTLINIFCITGPVKRLFVQGKVEIKGGCFIGGIERRS